MDRTRKLRRWFLLGGTATILTAFGVSHAAASLRAAVDPVPPTSIPVAPPVVSRTPSVSGDGQLVVYAGAPRPGAGVTDARTSTVFLQNRADRSVVELTTPADGVRPGDSVMPVISTDGCTVAVVTQMGYDLFRDDDQGDRWDLYAMRLPQCKGRKTVDARGKTVHTRPDNGSFGDWELVSTTRGAGFESSAADDVSPLYPPAITGAGALIAYTQQFSPAAADLTTVTLVDLTLPIGTQGRATPVAGTPADPPDSTFRYRGLREPSISDDGGVVAFTSDADNSTLLADWGTGPRPGDFATSHVYVWDRTNSDRNTNVRRISAANAESGDGRSPAVSGDGRFIAFVSVATNLVPGATLPPCNPDCLPEVYTYDRVDGSVHLVSRTPGDPTTPPVGADLGATEPAITRGGDSVFYVSRSTNLFPTRSGQFGGPDDGDIVLTVPATGAVQRVTTLYDGITPAPAANSRPRVSANGRIVVFDSIAGAAYGYPSVSGRQAIVRELRPIVTLASLDVGTVAVGYPGPEWYLVLANQGPSSFIPGSVTVDKPDFLISGGTCQDQKGVPVPPGGVCTVNLMLLPKNPGPISATLTIAEDGFAPVRISTKLSGTGGDPALSPTPAGGEAHPMVVGERDKPMNFSVQNVAFNPIKIRSVKVVGANPTDFQVGTDKCTGTRLDASSTCDLEVVFTPTGSGRRTASVVATTVDGAYTTMLVSGDAHYDPKMAVSATTVVAPNRFTVVGSGFSPNTLVLLSWADGVGHPVPALTDANGALMLDILVRRNDRPGLRRIVAQTVDLQVASAEVTVLVPRHTSIANSPRFRHL